MSALKKLLARPDFGEGELSFGAELELYIVDADGAPLHKNLEIIKQMNDPQLTLELNRYNLEYNFSPVMLKDSCFAATQQEALTAFDKINGIASQWQGRVVPIGIFTDIATV